MEQHVKKPRATWKRAHEKLLLKCYLAARNDASLKSDKGGKSKGWAQIVARLAKEGISADKDQSKTKYSRLMYEYDVFKRHCDLSGAGWDHQIQAPTLTDDGWSSLATSQPRNAALYKRFREEGFEHSEVCALIAGDSRANAAEATSVTSFLASETDALLNGPVEGSGSDEDQEVTQVAEDATEKFPLSLHQQQPNAQHASSAIEMGAKRVLVVPVVRGRAWKRSWLTWRDWMVTTMWDEYEGFRC